MVLAERNTTDVVRNGRRSRGPSPNTHTNAVGGVANSTSLSSGGGGPGGGNSANTAAIDKAATAVPGAGTPESSDDDNSTKRNGKSKAKQSEYEEKIRVGRDYQAVCPPLVPEVERRPELMNERALLVWSPTKEIPDLKLEEYISVAKEKYGYNGEQALGMLFWHKHDLERAVMDLANFTPFPDEWTIEDKVLFEQAFQFHGKSFHRIRQMLPDKSIASLVKYYYSWKKTRHRSSAMDRQEKTIKAAVKDGSENGSEVGSNEESDNDDKKGLSYAVVSTAGSNNSTNSNAGNNNSNINNNANNNNNNNINSSNNNNNNNSNNNSSSSSSSHNNNIIISNNSNTDMEPDQLCIFSTSTQGDEVLGFGLSSEGATTNGNANASGNSGGEVGGDPNSPRRVVVGGFCKTCNVVCHVLFDSPLGRMCKSCHTHWRRTGNRRPISGPESNTPRRSTHNSAAAADRSKRKPPKGMYINHDDLTALASCRNPSVYLAERDRKISALMAEVQKNRQLMEQLDKECDTINVDDVVSKPTAPNAETATAQPRISSRWSPDEIQVALLAFREYGKNYPMIAKLVATKTEAHVRTFYLNNRRRHNLDQILKEYEAGKSEDSGAEEQAEPGVDGAAAVAMGAATAVPGAVDSTPAATKPSADASNNGNGESTQEPLAKKDDKKKSELVTGTPKPSGGEEAAGTESPASALAGSSITVAASATDAAGLKSSTATITITDESDTATNSSSEVIASGSTGAAASSAITASATKQQAVASSDDSSAPKSISTGGTTGAGPASSPPTNLNNKRESAPMNVADQPPAKKIGLSPAVDFAGK